MFLDRLQKLKYYFCDVSKAGCTTWEGILQRDYKTKKGRGPIYLVNKRYPPERDATFKRFLNIRHPFDRLLSAFYNVKRKRNGYERGPGFTQINYLMKKSNTRQEYFTLEQFANFLTSPEQGQPGGVYYDRHWDAYSRSCRTCSETYSFVTRTETSTLDSGPILKILDYPEDYLSSTKKKNHIARPSEAKNTTKSVIKNVPAYGKYLSEFEKLPQKLVQKLYERYRADFEGFGYHFDMKTKMAYCSIKTEKGDYCC